MIKIPIGISTCLLGENVRYDGGHKRNVFILEVLSNYFDYKSICPEVAIGLGVPRKPIRLIYSGQEIRVHSENLALVDITEALEKQADLAIANLPDICGYVFMQNSPSCGAFGVKRYDALGEFLDKKGRGVYAGRVMDRLPLLPVEEAGRLNDPGLRDNFMTRVFAYADWKKNIEYQITAQRLLEFYSRYKYQVMAHHVPSYFDIGRLLANLSSKNIQEISADFFSRFMGALAHPTTRKSNINAMMHLRGYLKSFLTKGDQQELNQVIESYRKGYVPLIAPLTLLKHHLMKSENVYLKRQSFWDPYPEGLGLRNFVIPTFEKE